MPQTPANLEQTVRTLQIITAGLVMGVIAFAGVAVLGIGALNDPPAGVIISALAAGWAVMAFVLHLVVPSMIARQNSRDAGPDQLRSVFQTKTIIGLALLEGAAFFNIIALILEHNGWSLAITGGLVFWMLSALPTTTRVEHWIETQLMQQGVV